MSSPALLWYFADPMCSWCWGFSPIIEKIRSSFDEQLNIVLMLGGLRPGMKEPMSGKLREEILHHWREVHKMSGQPFSFDGAMPDGFIYDTEPACRAVITVAKLKPEKIFSSFKAIQSAFYVDQIDVTDMENLAQLANAQGVDRVQFLQYFESDEAKESARQHVQATRQAGVTGFPSLVLQQGLDFQFIAKGYRAFEELNTLILDWLARHPK